MSNYNSINLNNYSNTYRVSAAVGALLRIEAAGSGHVYELAFDVNLKRNAQESVRINTLHTLNLLSISEYCLYIDIKASKAYLYFCSPNPLEGSARIFLRDRFCAKFRTSAVTNISPSEIRMDEVEMYFESIVTANCAVFVSINVMAATKGYIHPRDAGGTVLEAIENGYRAYCKAVERKSKKLAAKPSPIEKEPVEAPAMAEASTSPAEAIDQAPAVPQPSEQKADRLKKFVSEVKDEVIKQLDKETVAASSHVDSVTIASSSDDMINNLIAAHEQLLASHSQLLAVLKASRAA